MVSTLAEENYNAGTGVLATAWAFTAAAIVVMALRVVAKIKINNFNVDDVVMFTALGFLIPSATCVTIATQAGLARNAVITHNQEVRSTKYYLVAQSLCIISCMMGRVAFIMYLRRLVPLQSKTRIILLILLGLQPVVNIVPVILMFTQCKDISALFDFTLTDLYCMPVRIQMIYGYVQAFNTATDFYLATFPIYSFWSLQLRLRIKIVLLCLLSMGLLYVHRRIRANPTELFVFAMSLTQFASLYTSAMVACIIKTVQLHLIDRPGDPTIAQAQLLHWAYIEAGLVVITSSVPCLRPLFIAMAKNFSSSPRPTYELTPAFGQSHNHTRTHVTSRIHTYVRGDANDGWGDGDSAREILGETRGGITKETTVTVQNEELRA